MRLWMIAPESVWLDLQRTGELHADADLTWDIFRPFYDWMRRQMATRIACYQGGALWWAWRQYDARHPKPDLRNRRLHDFPAGAYGVRLTLEVPDDEVLLSDCDLWAGMVLNDRPVTLSQAEDDAWDTLPREQQTRAAREQTWTRIFELEHQEADPSWLGSCVAERIQATFETLRARDICEVTRFRSRPIHIGALHMDVTQATPAIPHALDTHALDTPTPGTLVATNASVAGHACDGRDARPGR